MRGVTPLDLPVPVGGWRTDIPPHRLPPDTLRDGLNVIVDRDGRLKPRRGYEPLNAQPDPAGQVDPRIMGGIFWEDESSVQMVVATLTCWFAWQANAWRNITDPASAESGDVNAPTRLVQFGVVNGRDAIYGVNGALHEPMRRWAPGMPYYETVKDVDHNFTLAAADLMVLNNRLVAINTTEGGSNYT